MSARSAGVRDLTQLPIFNLQSLISNALSITLRHHAGLILWTAAGLGAYLGMVWLHLSQGTLRAGQTPQTIVWYTFAFAAYLGAILWTERHRPVSLSIIWGPAVIFRLLLLLTVPTLSDDVYRYLWDGHVATHGFSPYAYPIDSPALDALDIPQRALANNRSMASPYLPVAQLLFAALAFFLPLQPIYLQIVLVLFDLLTALFLARLLQISGLPGYRLIIYLWNPLVIIEIAHGAHIDAWMIFLTMAALWLTFSPDRSRLSTWLAPLMLALATLTKILPVLLLPVLFWRWRWRQLAFYVMVTIGLLIPSGLRAGWGLTGPLDGRGLFGAIRIYADQWNFNSGLFHWLEVTLLPGLGVVEANGWAKRVVGLTSLLILAFIWFKARISLGVHSTLRLMAVPYMAYLLLNTTVHPWYALILLVFLPFLPPAPGESAWHWLAVTPWLYLSASLALSYLTYLDPLDFREFGWVRHTEWGPTLVLLAMWLIVWISRLLPQGRLLIANNADEV